VTRSLACAVALVASSAFAAHPHVVVLGFASAPADTALAASLSEQVLTELSRTGALELTGASDLVTLLGIERQKQLMGCNTEACLVELTQALGAPWVVQGAFARSGGALRVDLKLLRASDGKAVFRDGRSITREAEAFEVVSELTRGLALALGVTPPAKRSAGPFVLGGVGVVALGVGTGLFIKAMADGTAGTMPGFNAGKPASEVLASQQLANMLLVVGPAVAGAGLVAVISALVWLATGDVPPRPAVSLWLSGQQAHLVLGGTW